MYSFCFSYALVLNALIERFRKNGIEMNSKTKQKGDVKHKKRCMLIALAVNLFHAVQLTIPTRLHPLTHLQLQAKHLVDLVRFFT